MQNSGLWDPWLPVVESSRLFAQRVHSAGAAHGAPPWKSWNTFHTTAAENYAPRPAPCENDGKSTEFGRNNTYCCSKNGVAARTHKK